MPWAPASVPKLREENPQHCGLFATTVSYYEGLFDSAELAELITVLGTASDLTSNGRSSLVFGRGSQRKSLYRQMVRQQNVELLWLGPCLPLWAYPLSLVAACHSGLVKLGESEESSATLRALTNLAMAELYSFKDGLLQSVTEHVRTRRWRAEIGPQIGSDATYFSVGIDGDYAHPEKEFAWLSFGAECPDGLKILAARFVGGAAV